MSATVWTVFGTASDVGKSTLVAALCRIASDDGLRVAPFKAQNMARNAYVVPDGGEIGVAQAVQAEAARVVPTVDHNPVLLKPEPDLTAQVIVHGRSVGRFRFGESASLRAAMHEAARASFDRLVATHDLVIVEGAGSPVELNLADHDLPNLATARFAPGPILLVGDIDRGGVFAQLAGTAMLLPDDLRARLAAVVVNKLRGDPRLFDDGARLLAERLGVPVLGVLPHFGPLGLADEDSLAFERHRRARAGLDALEVTVVDTPALANAEDALPFESLPGVVLRSSVEPRELLETDLVLLLGSKSTVHDLAFLRARGIDRALAERAARGGAIFGVCGGLQMLGMHLCDVDRVESAQATASGLGLLGCTTQFRAEKRAVRVGARRLASGFLGVGAGGTFEGFHLHHGRVLRGTEDVPFARLDDGSDDGAVGPGGHVAGTMIHRPFEDLAFRDAVLDRLAQARGLVRPPTTRPTPPISPIDRLAAAVRAHLDPTLLSRLLSTEAR